MNEFAMYGNMACHFSLKRWFALISKWVLLACGLLLGFSEGLSSSCPSVCFCPSSTPYVHCSRKNLPFIPNRISSETTRLYLNENNFQNPNLTRSNFTDLEQLEQLFIISSGIERIEVDTFSDLKNLRWLDLSNNHIKVVYDDTFRGLIFKHLFLNNNPGMHLAPNAFRGLKTRGLYIHDCAIADITIGHIRPLNGTLTSLWLDGNKFEHFSEDWKYLFGTLSNVRLNDNPLHCNCEVGWLYKFYTEHDTMFAGIEPPSCRTPGRLRGKKFNELNSEDFRCQLPVFKNVDLIFEEDIGKLTCQASGDPRPTVVWVKPDKSERVFPPKETLENLGDVNNEGVLYLTDPQFIRNAKYQCIAKNPAGNVTFTLNVAWPKSYAQQAVQDPAVVDPEPTPATMPSKQHPNTNKPVLDVVGVDTIKENSDTNKELIVISAKSKSSGISQKEIETSENHMNFALVDIIGAVIGTFLLTLLLCVVLFHLFHRHHERLLFFGHHHTMGEPHANKTMVETEIKNENAKMLHPSVGIV